MSDEPAIEITTEPGIRRQFGKGRFSFQNTAFKVSASMAVSSCAILVTLVTMVVMSGNPKKDHSDKVSLFLGVEVPQLIQVGNLNIPNTQGRPQSNPKHALSREKNVTRYSGPQVVSRPRNIPIPPGSMVEAVLVSGASDGLVKAQLKEPLIVAGETLLDVGTILMGYGQSGEDRLVIRFRKAVLRDGAVAAVNAMAADSSDKILGLKGSRIGYRSLKLAAGVGLSFGAGLTQGLQNTQGQSGTVVTPPSMKNALLNGAGRATIEEGQQMMNEYRNEKPVIEVAAGTVMIIIFDDNS